MREITLFSRYILLCLVAIKPAEFAFAYLLVRYLRGHVNNDTIPR